MDDLVELNNISKSDSSDNAKKDSIDNNKIVYDNNPRLATAIGIINYVAEKSEEEIDREYSNPIIKFLKNIKDKLTSWY